MIKGLQPRQHDVRHRRPSLSRLGSIPNRSVLVPFNRNRWFMRCVRADLGSIGIDVRDDLNDAQLIVGHRPVGQRHPRRIQSLCHHSGLWNRYEENGLGVTLEKRRTGGGQPSRNWRSTVLERCLFFHSDSAAHHLQRLPAPLGATKNAERGTDLSALGGLRHFPPSDHTPRSAKPPFRAPGRLTALPAGCSKCRTRPPISPGIRSGSVPQVRLTTGGPHRQALVDNQLVVIDEHREVTPAGHGCCKCGSSGPAS